MNNFVDYHSTLLARKLYKEQQQRLAAEKDTITDSSLAEPSIPVDDQKAELLYYPIFYNPASGYQSGTECLDQDAEFCHRWLLFYSPQANQLPQHHHITRLQTHQYSLYQQRSRLYAPRLAALSLLGLMVGVFVFTTNLWLLLLPLLLLGFIWANTHQALQRNSQELQTTQYALQQQQQLLNQLEQQCQLAQLEATSAQSLKANYTRKLEQLLQESLNEFFPSLHNEELRTQLQTGELQFFLFESPAALQLFQAPTSPAYLSCQQLIQQQGAGLCAQQPFSALSGLSRLHYFFAALCFEQGMLICSGFYDWVADTLHSEQRDFYLYRYLQHVQHAEQAAPTSNPFSDWLADSLYQHQLQQPIQILTMTVRHSEPLSCVLPKVGAGRHRSTVTMPGHLLTAYIKRDIRPWLALITGRIARR